MAQQEKLDLVGELSSQAELKAAMIARARLQGFRVAESWEIDHYGPEKLFISRFGGPVFVREAPHVQD